MTGFESLPCGAGFLIAENGGETIQDEEGCRHGLGHEWLPSVSTSLREFVGVPGRVDLARALVRQSPLWPPW